MQAFSFSSVASIEGVGVVCQKVFTAGFPNVHSILSFRASLGLFPCSEPLSSQQQAVVMVTGEFSVVLKKPLS